MLFGGLHRRRQEIKSRSPTTIAEKARHALMDGLMRLGVEKKTARFYSTRVGNMLTDLTPIGVADEVQRAYREVSNALSRKDYGRAGKGLFDGALAVAPVPGPAKKAVKELPMDEAARAARARQQGYREELFWRGDRDGRTPDRYDQGHFSRDKEVARGFAAQGGVPVREYRLRYTHPLRHDGHYTLSDLASVLQALRRSGDMEGARRIAAAAPIEGDWSAARLVAAARQRPDLPLRSGGLLHMLIERNARNSVEEVLKKAGFDAIDTGRDVLMLTDTGKRLTSAAYDPRRINSPNINLGLVPAGLAGGLALYSQESDTSGSNAR